MLIRSFFLVLGFLIAGHAHALTANEAKGMAIGEGETRIEALFKALVTADEKTAAFIQALSDDAVKIAGDKVFVVRDGKGQDAVTGAEVPVPADAEDVVNNNQMRGALDAAQAALQLGNPDEKLRAKAIQALLGEPVPALLPLVEKALAAEKAPALRDRLERVRAGSLLGSDDVARRLEAAQLLSTSSSPEVKLMLNERLADETDPKVRSAMQAAITSIDSRLVWGDRINAIFSGISLGSVLLQIGRAHV